jgi:hypothetical protein
MFQGMSVASKKSSKKDQKKKTTKTTKGKTSLASTRATELSESFSERFDNLRFEASGGSSSYDSSNSFESN